MKEVNAEFSSNKKDNDSFSAEDADRAAVLLAKLVPGFLPQPIFDELRRLWATPIVEVVPLRRVNDSTEVLLHTRPSDDPVFGGQLHTPGTVLRSTDTSFTDALNRVITTDLKGLEVSKPVFVKTIVHKSLRGTEAAHIYWVEVRGTSPTGQFYNTAAIPNRVIASQKDFWPAAFENFAKS